MRKSISNAVQSILIMLIIVFTMTACASSNLENSSYHYTEYQCDVKNFQVATTIEIDKENVDFATVKGNFFKFVTDPLKMYDLSGNEIAYADDTYHYFAQDTHTIYIDGAISMNMVGLVEFFGEAYDIYDKNNLQIASVSFNGINTNGEMYDMSGNLIADFTSDFLCNDFTVRISDDCELDEKAVLMIFCSYYSDQHSDAEAASKKSTQK